MFLAIAFIGSKWFFLNTKQRATQILSWSVIFFTYVFVSKNFQFLGEIWLSYVRYIGLTLKRTKTFFSERTTFCNTRRCRLFTRVQSHLMEALVMLAGIQRVRSYLPQLWNPNCELFHSRITYVFYLFFPFLVPIDLLVLSYWRYLQISRLSKIHFALGLEGLNFINEKEEKNQVS